MKTKKLHICAAIALLAAVAASVCRAESLEESSAKNRKKYEGAGRYGHTSTLHINGNFKRRDKNGNDWDRHGFKGGDYQGKPEVKPTPAPPEPPKPAEPKPLIGKNDIILGMAGALLGFFLLGPIGILVGALVLIGIGKMNAP
jgi:hypothetical protein